MKSFSLTLMLLWALGFILGNSWFLHADEELAMVHVPEAALPALPSPVPAQVTLTEPVLPAAGVVPEAIQPTTVESVVAKPAEVVQLPANPSISLTITPPPAEPTLTNSATDETISVDFVNENVATIVRNVADLYDLNVVIPESLKGTVSIKLHNVTWEQVYLVTLEPLGYTYTYENNIIRIRGKSESSQESMTTGVFIVNYADLKDMQAALTPLVDAKSGGRLQVDKRSNAIIITERPSRIRELEAIITQLDLPTPQVMIESKFVEVSDDDAKNLGIDWSVMSGYDISLSGGLNSSSSSGSSSGNPGLPAGAISNVITKISGYSLDPVTGAHLPVADGGLTKTTSAVLSGSQFTAVIRALNSYQDTRIVSNPTVVTLNNVEANVTVSTQYPLPQYSYNDQTGTFEVSGFDYKDIGIIMKVVPQVNKAGFITLDVRPELSTQSAQTVSFGGTSTGANAVALPIIDSRRTQSIVTIKDGYTLAIGGLISSQDGNTVSKIPLLGDLPIIGPLLFRSTQKTHLITNLIIFITAKTLDPSGATYKDVFDQRTLHEMRIKPGDVPGYKMPECLRQQMDMITTQRQCIEDIKVQNALQQETALLGTQKCKAIENRTGPWGLEEPINPWLP